MAWIKTIIRHAAASYHRKRRSIEKHELLILDAPVRDDEIGTYVDQLPSKQTESATLAVELSVVMRRVLTARELRVMEAYYGEGQSDRDIAQAMGISQQRVTQIRSRSLSKLRKEMTEE